MTVEELIRQLGDREWSVRWAACQALGKLGDSRAVEPLIARLGDEKWLVRCAACQALGQLGDARAVEPLIARLDDDYYCGAREALVAIGRPAVEPLIARLSDANQDVRQAACEALTHLGEARLAQAVTGALHGKPEARAELARLAGEGDRRAVEPLIARLGDKDSQVRGAACQALAKLGDTQAVKPLIARLGDDDWLVRLAASGALGKLGDSHAVKPLIARLGDDDWLVRRAACEALGKLGDTRAVYPLIGRLGDKDSDVRLAACRALDELGQGELARAILGALRGQVVCRACLARLHPQRPACRRCDKAANLVFGVRQVVAVLDENWTAKQTQEAGFLRGNWLKRRAVFDFDRVEIVAATDEEVERFAIQVGNDTDEWRQKRYKKMACQVAADCALSENTLRILRSTFGEVVRV
jgi:HEAT repeat protein